MSGRQLLWRPPPVSATPLGDSVRPSGKSLDAETRGLMDARFRYDFSRVRVHDDERASDSARSLRASAYTSGSHVVFQKGRYRPQTVGGVRLLAHELAHVVQQGGNAGERSPRKIGSRSDRAEAEAREAGDAIALGGGVENLGRTQTGVQCADEGWDKDYGTHKSFLQKPYSEFKAGLGEVKATTEGGLTRNLGRPIKTKKGAGTPAVEITADMLKEIYRGMAADAAKDPAKMAKVEEYTKHLNTAFKIMKIDTVEAQAVYLAHAFIESDQFRQFTESQGAVDSGAQKWVDDPANVKTEDSSLAKLYPRGKDINPGGKFEFIGRGPVQVTHRSEYVENIAMLEKTADQYDEAAKKGDKEAASYASLAREAAKAIKADPRQAANPKYTFLFSAAVMKRRGADVSAAGVMPNSPWTGADAASGWVAGGLQAKGSPQAAALLDKSAAFDSIRAVLMREAKKAAPADTAN